MNNLTPYQLKAIDYKKHISLIANAGSGKTFVLANRFVEIFLNEEININEIVAITFTEKAAGELKKKISSHINERIQTEKNKYYKQKLIRLQSELVEANISTIHSFCKNLLEEYSVEAEIDASFNLIDDTTAQEIKEIVVEETLQKLLTDENKKDSIQKLVRLFGSENYLRKELITSLDKRKITEQLYEKIYKYDIEYINKWYDELYDELFKKYFEELINKLYDAIIIVNEKILEIKPDNELALEIENHISRNTKTKESKIIFLRQVKEKIFTDKLTLRKPKYSTVLNEEIVAEIKFINTNSKDVYKLVEYYDKKETHKKLAEVGKILISLIMEINKNYNLKKKQKSYLDFEDLLLLTRKILQNDEVQKSLQNKYKYIMIDEYQDTNEIQYDIIMPMLEDLKKGNLFVVGDEKQSIYAFIDAELEIFEKTKNKIKNENNNGLLLLPHSFRMQPRLILFINDLFEKLFANPIKDFNEVEYKKLISTKDDLSKGKVGILIGDEERNISEQSLVAKKIYEILNSNTEYDYKDIAILCRKRSSFRKLEIEFVKHKIPFTIVGGKGFYQQQTIYDIYNYLSFILNPNDDAALIGILRSPFFNLSDLEIFRISQNEGKNFYEKLKSYVKLNNDNQNIISKLDRNINASRNVSVSKIIRNILNESEYWAFVSSKENADQEIVNIEKLISIARDFSKQPFKNLYDFVINLKTMIDNDENEGQAPISEDQNAVKIMTIHQSKGLEFPIVFLFDSNTSTNKNAVKEKSFYIDKHFGVITKIPINNYYEKYSHTPIGNIYEYIVKRKELAEIKRLFYVATTRAKDELYISATVKKNSTNKIDSFFGILNGVYNVVDKDKIPIIGNVEIMLKENNYDIENKICELEINVEKEIQDFQRVDKIISEKKFEKIYTQEIKDRPKNEIISATKISIYEQCPVKYELTYEIGYQPILEIIKKQENEFEYQPTEEKEIIGHSKIKGKIIHKILSKEINKEDFKNILLQELKREKIENEKVFEQICNDLEQFYKSSIYDEIQSYKNYKNEFEVYSKQNDYILYGIIDKLIISQEELIIIDYKTDNIKKEEITNRAKDYFSQLMFYAVVLNKMYNEIKRYNLQLVFIKHPNEKVIKEITIDEIKLYEHKINNSIQNIYNQKYIPNKRHCKSCHYFIEGKTCVKEFQHSF